LASQKRGIGGYALALFLIMERVQLKQGRSRYLHGEIHKEERRWSMSRKPDTLLVICALEMACLNRNPDRGLLFHSERWIQYIEIFYNRKRLHSYLGYRTPEEFVKNSLLN